MDIQDLGSIGELLAALATLATLIYLAKQIRHSSAVAKTTSYHMAIDQVVQCAKEPDFARLMSKIEKRESLTDSEATRAAVLSSGFIFGHEILLHLHKLGQVEDELWHNIIANNAPLLLNPMVHQILEGRDGSLSKELLQLLEARDGAA